MIDALQSFPLTTNAFTAIKYSIIEESHSLSGPPRKTQRINGSIDVSASRKGKGRQSDEDDGEGIRRIYVHNLQIASSAQADGLMSVVKQTVNAVLCLPVDNRFVATYEDAVMSTSALVSRKFAKADVISSVVEIAVEKALETITFALVRTHGDLPYLDWLKQYVRYWEEYAQKTRLLSTILIEFDRVYLLENQKPSVVDMTRNAWNRTIVGLEAIARRIAFAIRDWSNNERAPPMEDKFSDSRATIGGAIRSLTVLGEYQDIFESEYVRYATAFYQSEAKLCRQSMSPSEFVQHAEIRVKEEETRCRDMLPEQSWHRIISLTERTLWGEPSTLKWIAEQGLPVMLSTRDIMDIQRMHRLFLRVNSLKLLHDFFKKCVTEIAISMVKSPDGGDDEMIPILMGFKTFLDTVIKELGDKELGYRVSSAFETAFSSRPVKPAEMIAKFIDRQMRTGQKKSSDDQHMGLMLRALDLYRFTTEKDVFRTFYYRALAKRLLLSRSASDDHEKRVIEMLKNEYDSEFGKGEEMFKDLSLSHELADDFHMKHDSANSSFSKLNVNVLQYSSWPIGRRKEGETEIALPSQMQEPLTAYHNFYKSRHSSRKLDWFHSLGTASLIARFPTGNRELAVSLYQCVVLLLFAIPGGALEYDEIKERTGLGDADLKRTLQSLACAKKKILKKHPPGREVENSNSFDFNATFTDSLYKVTIPNIAHQETLEENKATTEHIAEDRKYYLDAAIVRIMKAKKQLKAEQLKTCIIEAVQAHFKPSIQLIKQRIEGMLDQDYISRDETVRDLYHYVA